MGRVEKATAAFVGVRDALHSAGLMKAFRAAHFKPLKFFLEHTKKQAIDVLSQEVNDNA